MTQTQHDTAPQYNDTRPPAHIRPPIPQPPLPILLHADALPLAPPLPTLPANRTTGNTDDSIGSDHVTMEIGPHDDKTTFLSHIRRRAADKATSSSHDMTVSSADGDKATATSAIDTGDVGMEGSASAPPADVTTNNTVNPIGFGGTIPMGPSDDTHAVNSDTATSPTLKRKRKYSPAKVGQRRRRWCNDGRDLNNTTRTLNSGGAQAGGDGGSGV